MADEKTKSRRKILLIVSAVVGVLVTAAAGYVAWVFMHPAKPQITTEKGMQCSKVGDCNTACSRDCPAGLKKLPCMRLCHTRCVEQGCPSAKKPFDTLMACIEEKCFMKCLQGPTPKCISCYEDKCAKLVKTCADHRCEAKK